MKKLSRKERRINNNSRRKTNKIINGAWGMKKLEIKNNKCEECKTSKNLEVHHEVYPTQAKEIREAILNEKIYYLCKKCHVILHKANEEFYSS